MRAFPGHRVAALTITLVRVGSRLRRGWASQVELQESWLLLNRPWEEEFLHRFHDGASWRLHGHRLPSPRRLGAASAG